MKMSEFYLPLDRPGDFHGDFHSDSHSNSPLGCLLVLVGNTHLHWGWMPSAAETLEEMIPWDTPHLVMGLDSPAGRSACSALWAEAGVNPQLREFQQFRELRQSFDQGTVPLVYASVVPPQTDLLSTYPLTHPLTLKDIPLTQTYPTLGVDRALTLWGAGKLWGWPAIVLDGGTALTLTGGNEKGGLVGGAILPGLGLQLRSLFQHTAALPLLSVEGLPDRWGANTPDAILSGITYTLLAGMRDFLQDWVYTYPQTQICFTGGDGQWLYEHLLPWLTAQFPANPVRYEPHLGLWGMLLIHWVL